MYELVYVVNQLRAGGVEGDDGQEEAIAARDVT